MTIPVRARLYLREVLTEGRSRVRLADSEGWTLLSEGLVGGNGRPTPLALAALKAGMLESARGCEACGAAYDRDPDPLAIGYRSAYCPACRIIGKRPPPPPDGLLGSPVESDLLYHGHGYPA